MERIVLESDGLMMSIRYGKYNQELEMSGNKRIPKGICMIQRKRKSLTKQIEDHANKKISKSIIDTSILVPSGSTLLNLSCTDNPFGAFALGSIVTLPGGSASGKTLLMLTMLAKCASNKRFDDYDLVYDDGEETCDRFDIRYSFGEKLKERLQSPNYTADGEPLNSNTIQDFKSNIINKSIGNKAFIWVLDSLDSLSSSEELEREYKTAIMKAKSPEAIVELKGSYKTEKAKGIGETLRIINGKIKHSKSVLFIVQQERDNIGVTFGSKKTTSGGNAPYFYSSHQVWLNMKKPITKEAKGQKRTIGHSVIAKVKKNKITGKVRIAEFDVYDDYGVDDISSCINFLIDTKHWKKAATQITAQEFDLCCSEKEIVNFIENNNKEKELQEITGAVWSDIEENIRLDRKRRFE